MLRIYVSFSNLVFEEKKKKIILLVLFYIVKC